MQLDFTHAGIVRLVTGVLGFAMALFHLWAVAFGGPEPMQYRGLHLLFSVALIFLWHRGSGASTGTPTAIDYVLLVAASAPILYIFWNYEYFMMRVAYIDDLSRLDWIMGILMIAMVLEGTRRIMGWALPLTAIVFLAYGLLIARVEPMRLVDQLFMTTEGIFGIPLAVSASYVMVFVIFGSAMERTGTGQLFMDFAMSLTGSSAGGPGKVAVVSSSLFGTISGSAVANVMVDGPISIPLMKRSGFKAHYAAAVEAVASTGGQIMPPIMGAAAFVMAEFLRVGYGQVIIWALIPSLLYYLACFLSVHFEAKRSGIVGLPRSELPRLGQVIRERGHLFLPVITILYVMYSGYSAPMAALWGTLACFPVAALRASTRSNVTLTNIIEALIDGARNALSVALACACAGLIIGVVTLTGIGITFTQFVVGLSQNTLLVALFLTMIAGIILGMGMPTTPAYLIMVSLLVPAVIKLGVVEPAAHMFAFYFAILSAITPPVALAVFAAAGLAKADLWTSGWAAMRVGAAGFIVPFMFVYEPALLMYDAAVAAKVKDIYITASWPAILQASALAAVGIIMLAAALHRYIWGPLNLWQTALAFAAAFCLIFPSLYTDLAGLGITAVVLASQKLIGHPPPVSAAAATASQTTTPLPQASKAPPT